MTLNIKKRDEDDFVAWYDDQDPKIMTLMSEIEARDVMRLALITDVQIRLLNMKGDEMLSFMHGDDPPQTADDLVESYRALSAGKPFSISAWSPTENGV